MLLEDKIIQTLSKIDYFSELDQSADYIQYWNDRARFVFDKADSLEQLFTVKVYE